LGRFDRKWGRCGLGCFFIRAILTGKPETANVKTRDFLIKIILSIFNGYWVSNAVDFSKKKDVLPTILSTFSLKFMGQ